MAVARKATNPAMWSALSPVVRPKIKAAIEMATITASALADILQALSFFTFDCFLNFYQITL